MPFTRTQIANMAISHLGSGKEIDDLDTERGQEAAACRRFFDLAYEQVLRDFAWPFATEYASLALVEEFAPNVGNEWRFSYRYPADAVVIRKIYSGNRRDVMSTLVPFHLTADDDGKLLLTDMPLAKIEYTKLVDDTSVFPADFVMAFSYYLATLIAPRLTAGDPFKRGAACMQAYFQWLSQARANAVNEVQQGEDYDSEFTRAREE